MQTPTLADRLFNATQQVFLSDQDDVRRRTRSLIGSADLSTLLIWNVVVAGAMHIGCGLIAHAVWDRIAKIEEKLRAMRDKRSADAPSIAEVTQEAKSSLAELEKVLAQLRGGTTSSNHSDAVEKIKSILVGAGWTGTDASNHAAAIVSVLSSQLSQAASDKSDSSPTPKP